jgi:hypothetical protein
LQDLKAGLMRPENARLLQNLQGGFVHGLEIFIG